MSIWYVVCALTICDCGVIEYDVIWVGVFMVTMIPDSKYYICKELKNVITCHEDVGLVEIGFAILDKDIVIVVKAANALGIQLELNYKNNADKIDILHVDIAVVSVLKLINPTLVVANESVGILTWTTEPAGKALAICIITV